MLRTVVSASLALALLSPAVAFAQAGAVTDPEVLKGIKQVDDGDLDSAILTLDGAVRRLASDPSKSKDLAQAYLYLGIAYVGKGHEAAAKAKFREAVRQIKDVSLSADKYPPRVIDLFEAAKEEARTASAAEKPKKKGGKKGLFIVGGLVVAGGGGAALALSGGEDSGPDTYYAEFPGLLNPSQPEAVFTVGPAQAGSWTAELTWTVQTPPGELELFVGDAATGVTITVARLIEPTKLMAEWSGSAGQTFRLKIFLKGALGSASYNLVVNGPPI